MKNFGIVVFVAVLLSLCILAAIFSQRPVIAQDFDIDLLHKVFVWKPYSAAIVSQNDSELNIFVVTNYTEKLWNRAYLPLQINSTNNGSLFFNLEYATLSDPRNATFLSEVRDNRTDIVLWSSRLNNTNGQVANNTFTLPSTMLNIPVEFRLYIITNGTGQHSLDVKKATLTIR